MDPRRAALRAQLPERSQRRHAGRTQMPPRSDLELLQSSLGNRALAGVLQREAAAGSATATTLPPNLSLPADYVEKRWAELERRVREFLERERPRIQGRILIGHSIAELVDLVRTSVPEALELPPSEVARILASHFAPLTIAEHRKPDDEAGKKSELVASLRNTMDKLPTELGIESKHGWAKVTMSGAEVGLKGGGAEVSGEIGFDKSMGVSTEVSAGPGKIKFSASISPPEKKGDPIKWEMTLAFVEGSGGGPALDQIADVVGKGEQGIRKLIEEAGRGGEASPTKLKEAFAPVKAALDTLAKLVGAQGAKIGISVEGDGPDVKVQAVIRITF